ncbi:MAG: hypothetical protein GEU82_01560 [Luteitalea sp.]|nr:hypothetical protein [Luteitalea sp.]
MFSTHQRLVAGLALLVGVSLAAQGRAVSRRDADLMKRKITAIESRTGTATRRVRTTITEQEVNAYLTYDLAPLLPSGVVEPSVAILGPGRVSGTAVVDLDRVRRERNPTSLVDPFYYLAGKVPVGVAGVLRTNAGAAQFELQSADVGGVPVPKVVLQQILTYYSRSAAWPDGISLDAPFPLPSRIQEIQVDRGQAVVVQ